MNYQLRMFGSFLIVILCSLFFSFKGTAQVQTARYTYINDYARSYYEYLPEGYNTSNENYPVIIFFHGAGERGDGSPSQLPRVLANGIPKLINNGSFPKSFTVNGKTFRFIVISPQIADVPYQTYLDEIVDFVIRNYRVDVSRIYMTGLSMGGGLTILYTGSNVNYSKRLAAAVPVCEAYGYDTRYAKNIADANLPIWATHNDGDPVVSVNLTYSYVNGINSYNPPIKAKYTIFHSASHDAWTKTYDPNFRENGLNIYEWMLQYQRGASATPPTTPPPSGTNQVPIPKAGSDLVVTLPTNRVDLTGSGSSDPDGTIVKYSWSKIAGPSQEIIFSSSATIANPTVLNLVQGEYTFRLTVTDNAGATASDDVVVKVNSSTGTEPPPTTTPPSTGTGKGIKINIYGGGGSAYNNSEWNNWNFDNNSGKNIVSPTFKYTDGTSSVLSAMLSQTEVVKDNGSGYGGGMAPAEVLRYTSYSTSNRTLTLSGLSSSKKYNLELYASRVSNSGNSTVFVIGSASQTVNTYNNLTQKAVFTNISPNAQGQVIVTIKGSDVYNYLNGFIITENTTTVASTSGESTSGSLGETPSSFVINPNPVTDRFKLHISDAYRGSLTIQIIDMNSTVRKAFSSTKDQDEFSQTYIIGDLPAGNYVVRVQMGQIINAVKIVKL